MDQSLTVEARPGPITFDITRTAVVVVDMQNDFGSPGGMFDRAGIDISGIQAIVAPIASLLDAARRSAIPICYLKMAFDPQLRDAGYPTAPTFLKHAPLNVGAEVTSPTGEPSRILVRDTWNTDIIDALTPLPGEAVIYKHRYSGFYETELEATLRAGRRSKRCSWSERPRASASIPP